MSKKSPVSRSGRFAAGPAAEVAQFTESISFDWRLWKHDFAGSIAARSEAILTIAPSTMI